MEIRILYLFAHIFMGFFTGFMGIYVNLKSHKTKIIPYYLLLGIIYVVYMSVMLGLVKLIVWIDKHWLISQAYIGFSTILMILSVLRRSFSCKKTV
jgi:uncharacterized membrane protein